MSYKYIFARYNENIDWIKEDNDIFKNSIIYNKGLPLNIDNEVLLPNYGKDASSHLHFIIDNYNNLPDACIFSQAKISDHYIYGKPGDINSLKKMREQALTDGESDYSTFNKDKAWTRDWNYHPEFKNFTEPYKNDEKIRFIDWFNIHIDSVSTDVKRFHPCCIFSVSKEKILSRPKSYYINILNEIDWHWNCIQISFVERSWYHIFNPKYVEKLLTITDMLNIKNIKNIEGNCQDSLDKVAKLIELSESEYINIMEIGFGAGHSAEVFLKNNSTCMLTSFELGNNDYVMTSKEHIDNTYPERHTLILGNSNKTIPEFIEKNKNVMFDVIFVDGAHDYNTVLIDILNCYNLAHKNTIIILDDTMFTSGWEEGWTIGPSKAWKELLEISKVINPVSLDYCKGHGMSYGNYNFN